MTWRDYPHTVIYGADNRPRYYLLPAAGWLIFDRQAVFSVN